MKTALLPKLCNTALGALVVSGALAVAALPAAAQQPIIMKLAGISINEPTYHYLVMFKQRIEERSGGRIKAEVYPSAQLGGFPRMIEGVQFGTIELYSGPPGMLRGVDPRVQVIDAPGMFDSIEHGHKTVTDPRFRTPYLGLATAKGLTGVSLYNYGPTSYATTSPIRKLEDFRGKKLRVLATKVELEAMNRLGASGIPLDLAEVLPALQNKVLDGVRSSIVVMGAGKYFTVAKYITNVKDTMIPIAGYASTQWLAKLPADLRQMVIDIGRELEDPAYRLALEYDERAVKLWRDNGAEVIELTTADQTEFMRRVRTVAEELYGNDPVLRELYTIYKEVAESHRKKTG